MEKVVSKKAMIDREYRWCKLYKEISRDAASGQHVSKEILTIILIYRAADRRLRKVKNPITLMPSYPLNPKR